ncbi:MAG: SIS domain-containing protein, partial [Abditibacteriota bacterium]|nr:SIS domain-containing protein [Abditibacteriota bacterium]
MSAVKEYLDALVKTIEALPEDKINEIIAIVKKAMDEGKKLFLMGNGGSASTASHLTADFQKGLKLAMGKRFKVISLADSI